MPGQVHIIGAGLAGLAAAVTLVPMGWRVLLYEQAGHAGGRCRSYVDETLDRCIDNGNHLVLSGNRAVFAYLRTFDGEEGLTGPARAAFPFVDLATGERWAVHPRGGRVPWWLLSRRRRVPGTSLGEYLRGLRLAWAGPRMTVAACLGGTGSLYRRFWEPLAVAALNTDPSEAAARLLWPVVRETFGRGEAACRPRVARRGLSPCFIDPALTWLTARGGTLRTHTRVRHLEQGGEVVSGLGLAGGETIEVAPGDTVILAVPPGQAAALVPGLVVPEESRAIINGHFRLPRALNGPLFLGLIGGLSQWLFVRDDVASVTVSAADPIINEPVEVLAKRLWPEVAIALGLGDAALSAWRIVKEKRATFAQTTASMARRPGCRTSLSNLFLAGDWTDTGLPATLEGTVRSGNTAASCVLATATTT